MANEGLFVGIPVPKNVSRHPGDDWILKVAISDHELNLKGHSLCFKNSNSPTTNTNSKKKVCRNQESDAPAWLLEAERLIQKTFEVFLGPQVGLKKPSSRVKNDLHFFLGWTKHKFAPIKTTHLEGWPFKGGVTYHNSDPPHPWGGSENLSEA